MKSALRLLLLSGKLKLPMQNVFTLFVEAAKSGHSTEIV